MRDSHVLDRLRWHTLSARLAEVTAAHPGLALQCDAIRAPVETLDRMWRDALPALHGDWLAAERIGALTSAAGPVAVLVDSAQIALGKARASSMAIEHRPCLLRIGELAIIAIAAARMAPRTVDNEPSGSSAMYVHVIHGLALQATPAEILARLDPHGSLDVLADLIARVLPRALVNGFTERIQLRRFLYDPVELGRWACLASAFGELRYGAARRERLPSDLLAWSPARADGIRSVARRRNRVSIHGEFRWVNKSWRGDAAVVIGARADGAGGTATEHGRLIEMTRTRITAELGPAVEWVGYALARDLEAARTVRAEVRAQLAAIGAQACVADPTLSAAIEDPPALASLREAPPRGMANQIDDPLRVTAWITPARVAVGDPVTLSWSTAASAVEITDPLGVLRIVEPTGTQTFTVTDSGTAVFLLRARGPATPTDLASGATRGTLDAAPDIVDIGAPGVGPERRVVVEVAGSARGPADTSDRPALTFVVFRPRVLVPDRIVDPELARSSLERVAASSGVRAECVVLPWVEDALAVIATRPSGADDPGVTELLEQLERAAARTPGLEHAIWIALVPDDAFERPRPLDDVPGRSAGRRGGTSDTGSPSWSPFAVSRPGEAALVVAVASPAGVLAMATAVASPAGVLAMATAAAALDAIAGSADTVAPLAHAIARGASAVDPLRDSRRGPAQRLRLVGVVAGRGVHLVDAPRTDAARAAGPGAPEPTGLAAICLDDAGSELMRTAIAAQRRGDGIAFTALVAVTANVAAVELRMGDHTALRIERPSAAPRLADAPAVRVDQDAQLSVDWRLASGSAREVLIEIAASPGRWVPLVALCGCSDRDVVPLWRLAPGDLSARIVATDGWNVDAVEISTDGAWLAALRGPFVLRHVGDHQMWADVPYDAKLSWTVPTGVPQPPDNRARMVALPPRMTGEVALHVAGVVERVALGASDGYRRH